MTFNRLGALNYFLPFLNTRGIEDISVCLHLSSRIDYCCNSAFTGISGQLLQRLQAIQNTAVRLITGAGQEISTYDTDTASTALAANTSTYSLQDGRVTVLVYECRHGMVPSYLSTYCLPT